LIYGTVSGVENGILAFTPDHVVLNMPTMTVEPSSTVTSPTRTNKLRGRKAPATPQRSSVPAIEAAFQTWSEDRDTSPTPAPHQVAGYVYPFSLFTYLLFSFLAQFIQGSWHC
jgi:hypothetical protein